MLPIVNVWPEIARSYASSSAQYCLDDIKVCDVARKLARANQAKSNVLFILQLLSESNILPDVVRPAAGSDVVSLFLLDSYSIKMVSYARLANQLFQRQ